MEICKMLNKKNVNATRILIRCGGHRNSKNSQQNDSLPNMVYLNTFEFEILNIDANLILDLERTHTHTLTEM